MPPPRLALHLVLGALAFAARTAGAAWPTDPTVNLPVCVASGDQGPPRAIPDGANGILLAWNDGRAGGEIYAQRVDALGAAQWAIDGIRVGASAVGDPLIVSDGGGGALIAWIENNGLTRAFKAQRVSAAGLEQWSAGGVTLRERTDVTGDTEYSRWYWDEEAATSDGADGFYLGFRERHEAFSPLDPGSYSTNLLLIHCDGAAALSADRILASDSYNCSLCGDGFFHLDDFAQLTLVSNLSTGVNVAYRVRPIINHGTRFLPPEIRAAGPIAGWSATLVTAAIDVQRPRVAPDFTGGAIVSWVDTRSGAPRLYAGRVGANGALLWGSGGLGVSGGSGDQFGQEMIADGGGAVLAWLDRRNSSDPDLYAQRLSDTGSGQWGAGDVALGTQPTAETDLAIAMVSNGSIAATWRDTRSGGGDIYARFVGPLGSLSGSTDGNPVSSAPDDQSVPAIVPSGTEAIVAWRDRRSGSSTDLYAQRVGPQGPVSGLEEPPLSELSFAPVVPNPSQGVTSFRFTLPRNEDATMWIADVRGRLVRVMGSGPLPAGGHVVVWDGRDDFGREVGSGIYFVVLDAEGRRLTRRLVTLR